MTSWTQLFRAYWPHRKSPADAEEAELWESELRDYFGRNAPSQDELAEVVRWMSRQSNIKHPPSLAEFRMWICIKRKRDRIEDAPPAEDCGMCASGWIGVAKGVRAPYQPAESYWWAYETVTDVPCLCSAGKRLLEKHYEPHLHGRLTRLAEQGREQRIAIDAAYTAIYDAAGQPSLQDAIAAVGRAWDVPAEEDDDDADAALPF